MFNTLHSCHNFPTGSRQAVRGAHICEMCALFRDYSRFDQYNVQSHNKIHSYVKSFCVTFALKICIPNSKRPYIYPHLIASPYDKKQ